ncbi:hypothetical protein EUGRSUZ_J01226 [Eucalyptus grandis]|uniref:Uncharacterized protein n=2 Tax=Eucalyptus grandis TaxID=71139 RepID=A0ACC3J543_EUCGR|nr:hypothetical protein EUGRSUZ_J01226 [Eucalyptus grandis]
MPSLVKRKGSLFIFIQICNKSNNFYLYLYLWKTNLDLAKFGVSFLTFLPPILRLHWCMKYWVSYSKIA